MHVHCEFHNVAVQCIDNQNQTSMTLSCSNDTDSLISNNLNGQSVDQGLDGSCTMQVQRNVDNAAKDLLYDERQGGWVGDLDDLLAEIVAELVVHHVRQDG